MASKTRWKWDANGNLTLYDALGNVIAVFAGVTSVNGPHRTPANIRAHVSIAQINAGFEILPALPGLKWRVIDWTLIAVGGAAAGATDVRLLATQAAGSVALAITTIAALTRSAVNKPHTANTTVLADGASYAQNDVNTAITVGKTGGALTTATFIDVLLDAELAP